MPSSPQRGPQTWCGEKDTILSSYQLGLLGWVTSLAWSSIFGAVSGDSGLSTGLGASEQCEGSVKS